MGFPLLVCISNRNFHTHYKCTMMKFNTSGRRYEIPSPLGAFSNKLWAWKAKLCELMYRPGTLLLAMHVLPYIDYQLFYTMFPLFLVTYKDFKPVVYLVAFTFYTKISYIPVFCYIKLFVSTTIINCCSVSI